MLVDVDTWPTWNPCLTVDGDLREGAEIDVTVQTPGGRSRALRGRVETVAPPNELAWRERSLLPGVFEGDHVVELMRRGPKQTKVVHRERFEGLLVPLFERSDLDDTRLAFEAMNRALKDRVEQPTG